MSTPGLQRRKIEIVLDEVDQLPTLPGVVVHLLPLLTADRLDRREIQLVVEVDAALSARIVRLAVELGQPAEVMTSIDAAFNAIPPDALAASLLSTDAVDNDVVEQTRLVRLWRHTLATGMAAQVIATRLGTVAPQTALLAGILHDIGLLALPILMPRAYAQVLERVDTTGMDLLEAERQVFGVDHAVLGKRLAQRWGFPEVFQSVIWLHHQVEVPAAHRPGVGTLIRVVRLADLLVRQEGFSYHPSERTYENAAEVAEGLGLSGAHAEQIGRQVAASFELNAHPVGVDDQPADDAVNRALRDANTRLGRLFRTGYTQSHTWESQARRADLLMRLNAALAACRSEREVLETVAATAQQALGLRVVVPYVMAHPWEYAEGIRWTAEGHMQEHFLYDLTRSDSLDPPSPDAPIGATSTVPVRAERLEGWLFERQGRHLGPGPFYAVAMVVDHNKVGGLVFALDAAPRDLTPQEVSEIGAIASATGIAVKRAQAEADLVSLSEELAHANRQLLALHEHRLQQQNVASLSAMATGAAHEINNPLAIISGRAQQLAAAESNAERRGALQSIVEQTARISDIITELRQFAQPPAPRIHETDPVALAEQVVAEFAPSSETTAVRVQMLSGPDVRPISVDPEQLARALRAIVQNALDACAQTHGATVTLSVQPMEAEAAVRFEIADNGPGMDAQRRARAFDPFYSGHESGLHRGLGLPKAYQAVHVNGGEMSLESAPGQGTTVRVTFPAVGPAAPAADEDPTEDS